MLVNFFRSDGPIVFIVLFLVSSSLWILHGFFGNGFLEVTSPNLIQSLVNAINSIVILGLGLALFFHLFVALFLNVLTNRYRLTGKNSYLVAFAYLLLSVGTMDSYFFTTQCVINVLVVFMMFRLFQLPSTSRPKAVIFDVSMLIGVMTIINPANIFLLVIVWVGIVSFRSLYIGDWIVSIIGVFLPALYLVVALYLFDLLYLIESWRFHVGRINFPEPKYITLLGTALLFIPSLFVFLGNYGQKAAVIRKMSNLILLLFMKLSVLLILEQAS